MSAGAIEPVFRSEAGRVLATLIRLVGDFELAEEGLQDAFAAALEQWPVAGVPANPRAWLVNVGRHKAIDRLRRQILRRAKRGELEAEAAVAAQVSPGDETGDGFGDDMLRLIFSCCHPALAPEAQVALTLRAVCGLPTPAVARAFLVGEETMAQRLVRAKQKIRHAKIPYATPEPDRLDERIDGVLAVIYLVFTEGYASTSGAELMREELAIEAIRLARLLDRLLPDRPAVRGLLALMLLNHPRPRHARGRHRPARGSGPRPLGPAGDCRGSAARRRGPAAAGTAQLLRRAGGDCCAPRPGAAPRRYRLAADRRSLRGAVAYPPDARGGTQSCRRRLDGGWTRPRSRSPGCARRARHALKLSPAACGARRRPPPPRPPRRGSRRLPRRTRPRQARPRAPPAGAPPRGARLVLRCRLALPLRQRLGVAIERATGVAAERGGGAIGPDRVVERAFDRGGLRLAGHDAEEPLAREQARYREGDGALRHGLHRPEHALVHLLLAAHGIERHLLHPPAVVEVGVAGAGLVEGEVAVDADAEADRVDRRLHEEPLVA